MSDDDIVSVEYAHSGRADRKEYWADVQSDEADIRRICTSLLMDLLDVDERATVWIDDMEFKLTKKDLKSYQKCIATVKSREEELRKTPVAEEEFEAIIEEMCDDSTTDDEIGFEDLDDMPELLKL